MHPLPLPAAEGNLGERGEEWAIAQAAIVLVIAAGNIPVVGDLVLLLVSRCLERVCISCGVFVLQAYHAGKLSLGGRRGGGRCAVG